MYNIHPYIEYMCIELSNLEDFIQVDCSTKVEIRYTFSNIQQKQLEIWKVDFICFNVIVNAKFFNQT